MGKKKNQKSIEKSHERSVGFGLDPEDRIPRIILEDKAFEKKQIKNKEFLEITRPYIEELFEFFDKGGKELIILTDHSGLILEVYGQLTDVENAAKHNLKTGVNMNEKSAGTNAVGTSLREGKAIQVTGDEHFIKAFKRYNCSAAPIFDSNNQIVGTLSISSDAEQTHPYALGLVNATVKAIENHLHNSAVQKQLYDAQQYAFSIMNHLSFGLIAIDLNEKIHWVNDTACRSLNIRRTRLLNNNIMDICPQWPEFMKIITKGDTILDEEGELNSRTGSSLYLQNAYSVFGQEGDKIGYVLTFRPLSRMLRLMNKYETPQLKFTFDKIIHKGKKMKNLVEYAKTVANTPSTVLITGESGTGKEVFAQSIHNASERKNNAFIAINCGAISPSLIESELFGYEEGAFTGAVKGGKPGKFEQADKGTLFLDEIGEMPIEMQVKLLRVLQEKTVVRVGGSKIIKIDVRLIAATNKNLNEEVKKNHFREDLFYRLSVIPIEIPPLRKRKMDIPPLYQYLLEKKANKLDRPIPPTDAKLLQSLVHHDWPGNIRELENFAEKTVILGGLIEQAYPLDMKEEDLDNQEDFLLLKDKNKLPDLSQIEKMVIDKYLEHFNNHITHTAHALGIGRNTLYQKMEKYNIKP